MVVAVGVGFVATVGIVATAVATAVVSFLGLLFTSTSQQQEGRDINVPDDMETSAHLRFRDIAELDVRRRARRIPQSGRRNRGYYNNTALEEDMSQTGSEYILCCLDQDSLEAGATAESANQIANI